MSSGKGCVGRAWILRSAAAAVALWAAGANAQPPVVDAATGSAASAAAASQAQQQVSLQGIQDTRNQTEAQLKQSSDLSSIPQYQAFANGGQMAAVLMQAGPSGCDFVATCQNSPLAKAQAGAAAASNPPAVPQLSAMRSYMAGALYSSQPLNQLSNMDYKEARRVAYRDSALSSWAMALSSRDYLKDAQYRSSNLAAAVNAQSSLRDDWRANSVVSGAIGQQISVLEAQAAAMLESASAQTVQADQTYVSADGGTTAPGLVTKSNSQAFGLGGVLVNPTATGTQNN